MTGRGKGSIEQKRHCNQSKVEADKSASNLSRHLTIPMIRVLLAPLMSPEITFSPSVSAVETLQLTPLGQFAILPPIQLVDLSTAQRTLLMRRVRVESVFALVRVIHAPLAAAVGVVRVVVAPVACYRDGSGFRWVGV